MTPQDKVPKCIPPSFYATCVADMNRQKLADHLRDPYLAIAFLSASMRAENPSMPDTEIERIGKQLARYLSLKIARGESIWPTVERFHMNPFGGFLCSILLGDEQTDGDA